MRREKKVNKQEIRRMKERNMGRVYERMERKLKITEKGEEGKISKTRGQQMENIRNERSRSTE